MYFILYKKDPDVSNFFLLLKLFSFFFYMLYLYRLTQRAYTKAL